MILHSQKEQKEQKAPKSTKSTKKHKKTQKRIQENAQNPNKRTKIEDALKKQLSGKSKLFAYLRFGVFCAPEENKIENKKSLQCNVLNTNVLINHFRCVCVYLREPIYGDINFTF